MKVTPTALEGVLLVEPLVWPDPRGFFLETYSRARYAAAGIAAEFVQDNHSRSVRHVIRGLHYQLRPGQAKLVRVIAGTILDVVVDLRRGTPTYGRWLSLELSATVPRQLYVPSGFAHGFCVLSEVAEVEYKVDRYYDPARERGIVYNDPTLAIPWPTREPILSDKDRQLPPLAAAENDFA
jgi:dTDP-4-dehydrorhamnose 3,5-epimerase